MRKFAVISILSLSLSALASAESWMGTLVDTNCKAKDLATHTKQCAIGCAKSGYGVVLADGKFVKFTEEGNKKALAALQATAKEKDLHVKVTGKMAGELIEVEAVEFH